MSNWIYKQVSLFANHSDNIGRPATYRDILLSDFGRDFKSIYQLRKLDPSAANYETEKKRLKSKLQCYTPAALLRSKAKEDLTVIETTGIMQFDFDKVKDFDIEDLKQCVFDLPFIGFCGLSCSGNGFYALALISEPDKLTQYAEHCFEVFTKYGIKPDTSKGRNVNDLRYLSYDGNMLIRENPEPLHIKRFKTQQPVKRFFDTNAYQSKLKSNGAFVNKQLQVLNDAMNGERMNTIKKVAFTLGGTGDEDILHEIKNCISDNPTFSDDLKSFLKCADDCFKKGIKHPLK